MKIKKSTLTKLLNFAAIAVIVGIGYVALFPGSESSNNIGGIRTVDAETFAKEILEPDSIILDIRTPQEFDSGKIAGAKNFDFYSPDFASELAALDKTKDYKIYCNSGNRSATAKKLMTDLGFINVIELQGGIQSWMAAGNGTCVNC